MPLVLVAGLAFDGGGYAPPAWGWSTVVAAALAAVLIPRGLTRPAALFLALLAALVGWTALSALWSIDVSESVLDAERGLLYLAAAAALVLVPRSVPLLGGVLGAITLVCAYALGTRIFGGGTYDVASAAPDAAHRLAEPLGYSNALAAFAAIGIVLAAALAAAERRLLVATPILVLVPTLYLTYSRGAWVALVAGALAAAAVRARRRTLVAVAAIAVVVVGVAAAAYGGRAYRAFTSAGPTVKGSERGRLVSVSGSSRPQYWHVAWREYRSRPWLGSGAGSFQRYWIAHRPALLPVKDAHSVELETLAELGPIGLALLAAVLALPLAVGVANRRHPGAAPAVGAWAVYLAHSAQDWDWEVPALTVAALACAAALLGGRRLRVASAAGRATCAVAAALAIFAFLGNRPLTVAQDALDHADPEPAARAARQARRWAPWSAEPWRLLGEAQLEQGDVEDARRSFRRGLAKDGDDWELWLDLALASEGSARTTALDRAAALNPLEPQIERLR